MPDLFDLRGKTALITGGGRGIGLAIAQAMAHHGARLILAGRSAATLDSAMGTLAPGEHRAEPIDVSSKRSIRDTAERLAAVGVDVDILVNNAGIDPHHASAELTDDSEWDEILATNLFGVIHASTAFARGMLHREHGCIINVSSVAGHVGLQRQAPYCASKGGVEQLTKAMALDWAKRGVRVNAIAYGFIETDLTHAILDHPKLGVMIRDRTPMGRPGTLDEVAAAAVFLASPGASYVTGHSLCVDGGWTAS